MRKALALLTPVLIFSTVSMATAALVEGPRLAFVRSSQPPSLRWTHDDLVTIAGDSGPQQVLAGQSVKPRIGPEGGFSWSPDGETVAMGGSRRADRLNRSDIYTVGAADGGVRRITRVSDAFLPVFSADGAAVFFTRLHGIEKKPGTSLWAVGADGSGLRRLSPGRGLGFDYPSAVSPAGDELLFTRRQCDPSLSCDSKVLGMSLLTGATRLLAKKAADAVYSPDGKQIALVSYRDRNGTVRAGHDSTEPASELYVLTVADGSMRRLTRTKDIAERSPSWDPSGQRIAFTLENSTFSNWIKQMNADGSCATVLLKGKRRFGSDYSFPAWRPGPGREAGRIAC
jgi:Tol biopolymer transport system component